MKQIEKAAEKYALECQREEGYPSPMYDSYDAKDMRECAFKSGAEWQAKQPLSQEQIDIKLSEYINSTKSEDKLKIGLFSLITISSMAIDANSAKTTLSTEFTHKGKRYKAEMLITQKEIKS